MERRKKYEEAYKANRMEQKQMVSRPVIGGPDYEVSSRGYKKNHVQLNEAYNLFILLINIKMPTSRINTFEGLKRRSFVMSCCDIVTFPFVSWVRCGA